MLPLGGASTAAAAAAATASASEPHIGAEDEVDPREPGSAVVVWKFANPHLDTRKVRAKQEMIAPSR